MDIIMKRSMRVYGIDYSGDVKYTVANSLGNFMLNSGFAYLASPIDFAKWKFAKIQAQARRKYAVCLFYGDSTTGGFGTGTTAGLNYNDAAYRSNAASQAAIRLNSSVQKATRDSIFGTSNVVTGGSGVIYPQFDPRITIGAGWTAADGATLFGGGFFQATTTTAGTLDFQPEFPFNNFIAFYPKAPSGTTNLVVQVDGSSAGYAAISNNGANGVGSTPYTIPGALAVHKLSFTSPNASVNAWLSGVICWDSANPGIVFCVAGAAGGRASDLATAGGFSALAMLSLLAPDLTIINGTINDQASQPAAATVVTNLSSVMDTALVSGDVIMLVNSPNTNAGFSNGYLNTVTPLIKVACDARNVTMIDLRDHLGYTWALANAAGYMDPTTGVHTNAVGESVKLDSFFKYL